LTPFREGRLSTGATILFHQDPFSTRFPSSLSFLGNEAFGIKKIIWVIRRSNLERKKQAFNVVSIILFWDESASSLFSKGVVFFWIATVFQIR
jgi:hypothetical protein